MPPSQLIDVIGIETWSKYFKFANLRNPWDKMVSQWFFRNRSVPNVDEESLTPGVLEAHIEQHQRSNVETELSEPQFAIETWIRYEHLREDVTRVAELLNIPWPPPSWPVLKSGIRPDATRDYRRFFTARSKRLVEEKYRDWIELGEYRF